jgi:opacity protein-like surface antigen
MKPRSRGKLEVVIFMLLSGLITSNLCAEEEIKEMIQGSGYITARYIALGMNDASATIYDPGVFEGQKTIEFGNGSGFSLAGGFLREGKRVFGGLELEWIMNSTDIVDPLPSSLFEEANSFDQLSLNLNTVFGANLFQRKFRPYVFGGIGYTEAQLIGHYGLATVDRGDESWDSTFGYHAGIGADVQLYRNLYLDAGCRYYATTDPRFGNSESWIEIPNSGYILHIGLAYNHLFPPQEKKSLKETWRDARRTGK